VVGLLELEHEFLDQLHLHLLPLQAVALLEDRLEVALGVGVVRVDVFVEAVLELDEAQVFVHGGLPEQPQQEVLGVCGLLEEEGAAQDVRQAALRAGGVIGVAELLELQLQFLHAALHGLYGSEGELDVLCFTTVDEERVMRLRVTDRVRMRSISISCFSAAAAASVSCTRLRLQVAVEDLEELGGQRELAGVFQLRKVSLEGREAVEVGLGGESGLGDSVALLLQFVYAFVAQVAELLLEEVLEAGFDLGSFISSFQHTMPGQLAVDDLSVLGLEGVLALRVEAEAIPDELRLGLCVINFSAYISLALVQLAAQ